MCTCALINSLGIEHHLGLLNYTSIEATLSLTKEGITSMLRQRLIQLQNQEFFLKVFTILQKRCGVVWGGVVCFVVGVPCFCGLCCGFFFFFGVCFGWLVCLVCVHSLGFVVVCFCLKRLK